MNREERIAALKAVYDNWTDVCDRILHAAMEFDAAKNACHDMLLKTAEYAKQEADNKNDDQGPILYDSDEWNEVAPKASAVTEKIIALQSLTWKTWDDMPLPFSLYFTDTDSRECDVTDDTIFGEQPESDHAMLLSIAADVLIKNFDNAIVFIKNNGPLPFVSDEKGHKVLKFRYGVLEKLDWTSDMYSEVFRYLEKMMGTMRFLDDERMKEIRKQVSDKSQEFGRTIG